DAHDPRRARRELGQGARRDVPAARDGQSRGQAERVAHARVASGARRARGARVSDQELRELERAAQASPEDVAAGLAYAAALERSGSRHAAFLEHERLARLGSETARERVARW